MKVSGLVKRLGEPRRDCPQRVGEALLNDILDAARWTPSAADSQPWELYIVDSPALKARLDGCLLDAMLQAPLGGHRLAQAPVVMVVGFDRKRATARFGSIGEKRLAIEDTAAAIAHMRLAAGQAGAHLSWIRDVNWSQVARILKLPSSLTLMGLLTLGFGGRAQPRSALPPRSWVHRITD